MNKILRLVIADDLTGANDTGVHFLSKNEPVTVIANPDAEDERIGEIDAATIVVNTNTRFFTPEDAYSQVQICMRRFLDLNPVEIYKKIDSTLRGNVGSEIEAVMNITGFRVACVASSAPRNGRTTVNGLCYVNGKPLHDTEIGNDPFTPVKSSDLKEIISSQTSKKLDLLPLKIIRSGEKEAAKYLDSLLAEGNEIIVADSESVDDLVFVRKLFENLEEKVLLVGSAGFFYALGVSGEKDRNEDLDRNHRRMLNSGVQGMLFVVGSLMNTSIRQAEWLCRKNVNCEVRLLSTAGVVEDSEAEIEKNVSKLSEDLKSGKIGILQTEKNRSSAADNSSRIGQAIGAVTAGVINQSKVDVLFATGGDTALYILKELGVSRLRLKDELFPGIPAAEIMIPGKTEPTLFISKAGSYGEESALEGVVDNIINNEYRELTK